MIIKTDTIREASSAILLAISADRSASTLEIKASGTSLSLNVSNGEYFVSIKSEIDLSEDFTAYVDAKTFLNLVSGIATEQLTLAITDKSVKITAGKSKYTLPIIIDTNELRKIKPILLANPSVSMTIPGQVLSSVVDTNYREIQKVKKLNTNDIHKQFYFSNEGCFTYTDGACINSFELDKTISILLNERIVKLFKLFKTDVDFNFGKELAENSTRQTKVSFSSENIYVGAIVNSDDINLNKLKNTYETTKRLCKSEFKHIVELPTAETLSVLNRLTNFNVNTRVDFNRDRNLLKFIFTGTECLVVDPKGNTESITVENSSEQEMFTVIINGYDLKSVLDTCDNSSITMKFGLDSSEVRMRPILLSRNSVSNLVPEWPESEFI